MIAQGIIGIISLTLLVIVYANVFMPVIKGINTTAANFSGADVALWGCVGLIGIAGIVYTVAGVFGLT